MTEQLIFKPHPKQEQFIEAIFSEKYSFLAFGGAMGGGKSFCGIAALILLAKIYSGSKWCIIRESLPTIKRTTLPTFKKVLPLNFLESYNQQENIAHFKNGSQIIFLAEDYANDKDFDRFKGLEVNGFLLEQIEELNKDLLDVCTIRAGRHKIDPMPKPIILATLNPSQNWVKEAIYERYTKNELPHDWFYLPSTIFDNPVLNDDKDYMDRLKNLDPITYKRHIEGDWSAFSVDSPFAYAFSEQKHVGKCEFNKAIEVQLSFDFNVDPVVAIAAQSYNNSIYFIKEFKLKNSDIYELCDHIKSYFPFAVFRVTGDATGQARSAISKGNLNYYHVIKQRLGLTDLQMRQPTINPSISDSRVLLNSMLQNYNIVIDKDLCPNFIFDLKYVEVDAEGDILKDRSSETRKADLLDAGRYLLNTFHKNFLKGVFA